MRRKLLRNRKKAGKIFTGILLGGLVGMTVKWLVSPALGDMLRHRLDQKV